MGIYRKSGNRKQRARHMSEVEQMIASWVDPQQQKYGAAFLSFLRNPVGKEPSGRGCPDAHLVRASVRNVLKREADAKMSSVPIGLGMGIPDESF